MADQTVILGKVSGVQGVKGWLKVFSYTRPADQIFQYENWQMSRDKGPQKGQIFKVKLLDFRPQGKKLVVKLDGVNDRTEAESWIGLNISVDEADLPELDASEFYWRDLIGLTVEDVKGVELGEVIDIMQTGSNDVLLLKDNAGKSLAIPWLDDVVIKVDIENGRIIADWAPLV